MQPDFFAISGPNEPGEVESWFVWPSQVGVQTDFSKPFTSAYPKIVVIY